MRLELEQISKSFGDHVALRDVSLAVDGVRALVLIGPSGGGKSTLLRILAGLEYPDRGRLAIGGNILAFEESALREHRRQVGVVFQAMNLFPHLTALENITLPLVHVHGMDRDAARDLAMAHLRRFRLETHAHKKPAELSGGQRQRVAIVRAVAIRPKLLLFDEPTSALDPEMTAEVLDMIGELRAEGRDLVLVTHHLAFARSVADHAVFLADGRIVEHAPGDALFSAPSHSAVARFLDRVLKY
ncbi:MAG: amino acid ABC transporter ATP-binding protein [Kiritimatiellae bacterium]|nr:amino acid ABC transporter ATP-binding protein [Kiritimatiellia bacterium]MDW8457890.1 amino acid ABC transporter ATP-binding protein [Verrucomicrobiota bacterium]